MKIFEITNSSPDKDQNFPAMGQPTKTATQTSVPLVVDKKSANKRLGPISSRSALIRPHPSQQEIIKREREPGGDDASWVNDLWRDTVIAYSKKNPGNTWLPQYTEIRTKTDPSGETRTQTTEMRLQHGYELSIEAIMSLATRVFPNFERAIENTAQQALAIANGSRNTKYIKQAQSEYKNRFTNVRLLWDNFVDMVVELYDQPTKNRKADNFTEDANLIAALSLLRKLLNSPMYEGAIRLDLHGENIMVRNTGFGWQPVLSDPIAG